MKKLLLLIALTHVLTIFGQEKWAFIGLQNEINDKSVDQVIPIVNPNTERIAVFFKVKTDYICYLLNENQEIIETQKIESIPKNFDMLAGSAYQGNKFTLYFSNNTKSKHGSFTVDFDKGNNEVHEEFDLNFKKERLIGYVENKDKFYALSVDKNSSILNLYRFNFEGIINSTAFDLSNEDFETDNELQLTLDSLLFGKHSDGTVETIDSSIPNTLETTAALTKLYINDSLLTLTNNTFQKFTYLIKLNLDQNSIKLSKIENKNFEKKNLRTNSNSFVFNSMLFDVYSDTDDIIFNIYNINNNTSIKNFHIKASDSIPFKNSPFIHEVLNSNSYRDLGETARFIRKINTSNIGISIYPHNDEYILTLGASEKIQSSEFAIIGGVLGGMIGAAIFSAFDSYGKTRSTRIECIFDKQFNHIEGNIPDNGFDLIQEFIKEKDYKYEKLQTVFKYQNKYIWGYYKPKGKFYGFYEFSPQ